MKRFSILSFFLCSSLLPGAQADLLRKTSNQQVDSFIRVTMQAEHIPGLSLAVVKGGNLLFSKGYGFSNLEHRVPATPSTVYCIASITKSFTAIAVQLLVEEKRLSLQDTIGRYLPDLPASWKPVTIRQLLNHTSGISSFSSHQKIPCAVGKDVRDYQRGDAWKEVACLPLEFAPGSGWEYGDTNYYLLGLIIEAITQLKYEVFLAARIFQPLGMHSTRLVSYRELIPQRAEGYLFDSVYLLAPRFEIDEFSNGGIVSTVEDMRKLHTAFTTERLLQKSSWQEMWTPTRLNDGSVRNYGLGFGLTPFEGRKRVGHNGGGGLGFSTALTHFPDEGITVILLCNVSLPEGRSGQLANQIASYYFKAKAGENIPNQP